MSTRVPDSWDDDDDESPDIEQPSDLNNVKTRGQPTRDNWDDDESDDDLQGKQAGSKPQPVTKDIKNGNIAGLKFNGNASPVHTTSMSGSPLPSFEPAVRILKREKSTGTQTSGTASPSERQTLQEREEKYRLARERIFGTSSGTSTPDERAPLVSAQATPVRPIIMGGAERGRDHARPVREPFGPSSQPGFMRRQAPNAPSLPRNT